MAARAASVSRRQRRSSSTLVASLVLGGCVVAAAFLMSRQNLGKEKIAPPPVVVAEFDTVQVPVPVEPVAIGSKVKDIKFKTVAFPKHQIPGGSILALAEVSEAVVVAPLPANVPLFRANLSFNATGTNPVMERIPQGMRAMTIRVDATAAVEGWAGSGSVVDVLLVEKDRTAVVAENVKILSAERSVTPVEGQSAPNVPSTVTLLVSQEQCLAINTAIPRGRIAFALRSARDQDGWRDTVFNAAQLSGPRDTSSEERQAVEGYLTIEGKNFAVMQGRLVPVGGEIPGRISLAERLEEK
jgi:Flp pilus assembly protein CpaB